jgi:GGDEF domain-containing protein
MSAEQAIPHLEDVRRIIASYCFVVRGPRRPRTRPAVQTLPTGPRVVVTVTVSIGAAERESPEAPPRHVIRAAHQALRHAVETGRNQVIA